MTTRDLDSIHLCGLTFVAPSGVYRPVPDEGFELCHPRGKGAEFRTAEFRTDRRVPDRGYSSEQSQIIVSLSRLGVCTTRCYGA